MTRPLFPRTPILNGSDVEATRKEFREYFLSTFNRYEQLFESLVNEQSYQQKPIALRHPSHSTNSLQYPQALTLGFGTPTDPQS